MTKEKRYIHLEYTLVVDADEAEARSDELMDLLDASCSCVTQGEGCCDMMTGGARIMTEEQMDKFLDEEEEEEDDRPRRRRRKPV